jgi:hypothetical protein
MPRPIHPLLFALLIGLSTAAEAADRLQFNRDVRPILSDKCFACHGNDKNKRVVDLRLDVRIGRFRKSDRAGKAG